MFDDTFSSVVIPVSSSVPLPPSLRFEVLNLASAHLVCSVALTGVMALQAARWWSEHADDEDTDLSPSAEQHAQKRTGRKLSPAAQRRARRRRNSASKISASGTASRLTAATAAAASELKGIKE